MDVQIALLVHIKLIQVTLLLHVPVVPLEVMVPQQDYSHLLVQTLVPLANSLLLDRLLVPH
jgi:hypothetical protein